MILLSLVLVLLAPPQEQKEASRPVRRIPFDDLFALRGEWLKLDLCPERSSYHEGQSVDDLDWNSTDVETLLDAGRLDGALRDLFGKSALQLETTFDGRSLVIRSQEPLPADVDAVVTAIGAAMRGEERLEVRILSGRFDDGLPVQLDFEEADRRERAWIESSAARLCRTGSIHLVDGVATTIHDVEEESCVHGWTIESGASEAIFGPVTNVDTLGLTASVRSARWPDATWLDLALRYAEPAGARRDVTATPQITLSTPVPPGPHEAPSLRAPDGSRVQNETVPLRFEMVADRFMSLAASLRVPHGKALWIPCGVATHAGLDRFLLDLRVRGPWRPPIVALPGGADAAVRRSLVHVGGLASSGSSSPNYGEESFLSSGPSAGHGVRWWPSRVSACAVHHDVTDALMGAVAESERSDARVIPITRDDLLLVAPAAAHDAMVSELRREFASTDDFEVRARIVAGSATLADLRLPAAPGRIATLWSGVAGPFLQEWRKEGEDGASAAQPVTDWFLDGFALSFLISREDGGPESIGVSGTVNLLTGSPIQERRADSRAPVVEKIDARRLVLAERHELARDAATTTLRLGGTPFTLEVTVTRR
jgi:hypothetical protein